MSRVPPAGWYPDPDRAGSLRLFDGTAWTDERRPKRRRFAAMYFRPGPGIALLAVAALLAVVAALLLGGTIRQATAAGAPSASSLVELAIVILPCVAAVVLGLYFLRGTGSDPVPAIERARAHALARSSYDSAVAALRSTRPGAAQLVAIRNVDAAADRAFGGEGRRIGHEAVAAAGVDRSAYVRDHVGYVNALGQWLEVFPDWVILGQQAYDVDQQTRMSVYLDGGIQVVARPFSAGGVLGSVNEHHDMRRAEVQIVSSQWSLRTAIVPDDVNEARRIAEQLAARVELLRPRGATSADIRDMLDAILQNTTQPPAEKLRQLSHLRFERLLSDADFEAAKARILGLAAT